MYGPLHEKRHAIVADMSKLPIRTGDVFFRTGNEKFLGIPFSQLVAKLSRSRFSHASMALVDKDGISLVEVSNEDTLQLRLIDWLDLCYSPDIAVYRPVGSYPKAENVIREFLAIDPQYNYMFQTWVRDRTRFYCTESAAYMMEHFGVPRTFDPKRIRDILPWHAYLPFLVGNWLVSLLTGGHVHMPTRERLYFAGDASRGILSSPYLAQVYPNNVYRNLLLMAEQELLDNPLRDPNMPKPAADA